jgi:hypothetical protein
VLGGLFLVLAFVMALFTRSPQRSGVERAGRALTADEASGSTWFDENAEAGGTIDVDEATDAGTEFSSDDVFIFPNSDTPQTDAENSELE